MTHNSQKDNKMTSTLFMGCHIEFAAVLYMYKPQLGDEVFHLIRGDNSEDKFTKPSEMSHDMWHVKVTNLYNAWMQFCLLRQNKLAESANIQLKTDCQIHLAGSLAMFIGSKIDLTIVSRMVVPTTSWQHLLIEFVDRDSLRVTKPAYIDLASYLKLCLVLLHAWHKWQLTDATLAVDLCLDQIKYEETARQLNKELGVHVDRTQTDARNTPDNFAMDHGGFKRASTQSNLAKASSCQRQQALAGAILSTALSAKTLDQVVGHMQFTQISPELQQTALYLERQILKVFEENLGVVLYQTNNSAKD
jgi:hypothetical protein